MKGRRSSAEGWNSLQEAGQDRRGSGAEGVVGMRVEGKCKQRSGGESDRSGELQDGQWPFSADTGKQ